MVKYFYKKFLFRHPVPVSSSRMRGSRNLNSRFHGNDMRGGFTCTPSLFSKKNLVCGFTLIEMMVSIAIIAVITSIVLFNHRQFSDSLDISNLSYDVALSIKQAQTYGINVKGFNTGTSVSFDVAYGMRFDLSEKTSYLSFADKVPRNQKYDVGELADTYAISKGNFIESISCGPSPVVCPSGTAVVDITFHRPDPDASFVFSKSDGTNLSSPGVSSVDIVLRSPQGLRRAVEIGTAGQVSIKSLP